jgi:hypothetical protein
MRKMIAVALLAASSSVFALQPGSATEYQAQVETCKTFGDQAVLYKMMAAQGKQPTFNTEGINGYLAPIKQAIATEIYANPTAYDDMGAWKFGYSYCWDHIDSALRQAKADGAL